MDNQDKIFNRFKDAAENAETKDFPAMEKVWSRVEEKLDKKEDKKTIALWKKIAVAASILLVISIGSQFIKKDKSETIETTNKVVTTETAKEPIEKTDLEKDKDAVVVNSEIVSKNEAEKIINNQIKAKPAVAATEVKSAEETVAYEVAANAPIMVQEDNVATSASAIALEKSRKEEAEERETVAMEYAKTQKSQSYRMANTQMAKKNAPLIIMNGNAMAHSDDVKKDKMMQAEIENVRPENVDSLVILDEPLYIIDGIYYSESDLFGNNPTSPYAPLDKQDIKTITILQDTEATEKYGEKGKKGVVIITTKKGKPTPKK